MARASEAKAVKAEKEARKYNETRKQFYEKERQASRLFQEALQESGENEERLLKQALELCEQVLTGYTAIDEKQVEVRALMAKITARMELIARRK
jgi:phage-related minor tail protein